MRILSQLLALKPFSSLFFRTAPLLALISMFAITPAHAEENVDSSSSTIGAESAAQRTEINQEQSSMFNASTTDPLSQEPALYPSKGLSCIDSFNETRSKVLGSNTQSILMLSSPNGISPYITLQTTSDEKRRYILWQTLNGEIRGYALRDGKGFDYTNSANTPLPLSWHPTLIWDNLLSSNKEPRNYSCVLTGRTRVMGKRVSLLRLIPQEGLRYSFMIAKEDESDFPVELTIIDHEGKVASRFTVMDSRIITGVTFPVPDSVFDSVEITEQPNIPALNSSLTGSAHSDPVQETENGLGQAQNLSDRISQQELTSRGRNSDETIQRSLPAPTESAGATVAGSGTEDGVQQQGLNNALSFKSWPELNIPTVYNIVAEGRFNEGGQECFYQEYSDGLTSFRVYRNRISTIYYPVLTNGTISIVRKQNNSYEYSVVGEVPVSLAEFVLARIGAQ